MTENETRNGGIAAALAMLPTFREVAAKLDADPETLAYLEEAHDEALAMPLEVFARSGWYNIFTGQTAAEAIDAEEFAIVFAWGGPAVRAYKVAGGDWQLQGQDWGTEWERVTILDNEDCRAFWRVCDYILEANQS